MTVQLRHEQVDEALRAFLTGSGTSLRDWRLRSMHRRGHAASSVLVEGDVVDTSGRERSLLYVMHTSARPVPTGAAVVEVAGADLHIWQFPDDPYLPGLRPAVSRRAAATRLDDLWPERSTAGPPSIHTRSYRPTRRAVVAVTPADGREPALFLKVLGGRTPERIEARTAALVAVHEHLRTHLPVPRPLDHDPATGIVALEGMAGTTVRALLRTGQAPPPVDEVVGLVDRLAAAPAPPGSTDPAGYADVRRHLDLLAELVPDLTVGLDGVADAVADIGGPTTTVHGDLHDGQLLVEDGALVGLLDVDGAGTGPLAHDLGRLVANVEVAALTAPDHADLVRTYADELAEALTAIVGPEPLAVAAAGAWVGLATGPHRVRGAGWQRATRRRVEQALTWFDRA